MSKEKFDERSEKVLATLLPAVQPAFRKLLADIQAELTPLGFTAKWIGGTRTYAEQDLLYAQGRTRPGAKVTNAKGGQSNHNFGVAADLGIFNGKDYLEDSPLYDKAAKFAKAAGLEWGGDWHTADKPHYQYPTGLSIAAMRAKHDAGLPVVAAPHPPATPAVKPPQTIRLIVDGDEIDEVGTNKDGDTTAPIRAIADALDADTSYDPVTRTIRITKRPVTATK